MAKLASLIKKRSVEEVFTNSAGKAGKKVQFSGIDLEEERNRSKRGAEIRRERKDNKKMADQNRNGRIRATLAVIRSGSRAAALIRLCLNAGEKDVRTFLHAFLNGFVAGNPNVRARLAAFRQVPANRFENLTGRAQNQLIALNGEPSFEQTFELTCLPQS